MIRFKTVFAIVACGFSAAGGALAEVTASSDDGFSIHIERSLSTDAEDAWRKVLDIPAWWSSEHSWSGDAANMSVTPAVGGCWCEGWAEGEVVHGRILAIHDEKLLRLSAPLGPLQGMGVRGVLTFSLVSETAEGSSKVLFDYIVVGASYQNLSSIAPVVDAVLSEQADRLVASIERASP